MVRTLALIGMLLAALLMTVGCGGKKNVPVVDNTATVVTTPPVEEVVEETPVTETPAPVTNYATMSPQEYGIEDVYFAYDEYTLSAATMTTLTANAKIMKEHGDVVYLIEGHCDERGTVEYNLALGEKRAAAVRDYLANLGVKAGQLRVTSYGEERPFVAGSTEASWAKNRRAHFARP
ncbi:MAG: peptidoglycan-associated lipoprotein Pal [bacterium]|nr:peptidoglycan-associated lipoprotein Pal [bacterium]